MPSILEKAPVMPGLTSLELKQDWTEKQIELAVSIFPNLRKLGRVNWATWPPDATTLSSLVFQLARFERLESLTLTDISQLPEGVHFRGICGNSKANPHVRAYISRVAAQREKEQQRIAAKIVPRCSALKVLWIGAVKAEVTDRSTWVWYR